MSIYLLTTMKLRRSKLSFNKEELVRASLQMGDVGISFPNMSNDLLVDKFNFDRDSFGWIGATGDANKFYPDLNVPEQLMPKPEDFIKVPFRLISATIVGGGTWKATDFSDTEVLKASMNDLHKKPLYFDHDTDLLNWVGIVEAVSWDSAKGDVPAGINGLLAIDGKTNAKLARGVLLGSVFSNSVTVEFDWYPSHTFDSAYEFEDKVGTFHEDGTMVRRIVKTIHNYHETSLVWLGADPFAKLIGEDGNLVNIDKSSVYEYSKLPEDMKKLYDEDHTYKISHCFDKNLLNFRKKFNINRQENSNQMNEKLIQFLKTMLGVDKNTELTQEHLEKLALKPENLDQLKTDSEKLGLLNAINVNGEAVEKFEISEDSHVILSRADFDSISNERSTLLTTNQTIETELGKAKDDKEFDAVAEIKTLKFDAEAGKTMLNAKREEVKRRYGLSVNNDTDDAVLKMIDKANSEELVGLLKQYTKTAVENFTGTCKDCGSHEFEFRSSDGGEEDSFENVEKSATFQDLLAKYGQTSMNISKNNNN